MRSEFYTAPGRLEYREADDPVLRDGDALIRIESAGICGSDMHAYLGHDERRPAPLILGHEAAGTIVAGQDVGQRVTINPLVSDPTSAASRSGRANLCPARQIISMPPREGAFAGYVAMPTSNLVTVPDHVPLDKAALAEPLAVRWRAARLGLEALHPADERRAHVIGGGAIGLASVLALRAMGVEAITVAEPNAKRAAYLTERCGVIINNSPAAGSVPLLIDAVGMAATRSDACAQVAPGGVIVHIGLGSAEGGLDLRRITLQEIRILGSYTYTLKDIRDTCAAIFDGRLGPTCCAASPMTTRPSG